MSKHTVQGKKIKDNVVFIGACNPYRKKIKEVENTALIKKESKYSNLIYNVNPLTYTQLYYVLNFGSLSIEDEKKYIESIAEYELNLIINDKTLLNNIHRLMVNAFIFSQQYIREKNGKESVSLREIQKFLIIYKFILHDFKRKQNLKESDTEKEDDETKLRIDYKFYHTTQNETMIHKYALSVGIFICFYIRLNFKEREYFEIKIKDILEINFLEYSTILQKELINNISFEKGIAPNKILKLNLLITFIGILTKIAVFLVGPPGCSKTLCLNLLKKSMKGINSRAKFWKLYPQLFITSFQGSLTSTSKAIKQTFNRAENTLKKWKEKKKKNKNEKQLIDGNEIISLVFIDEIGLCEISPFNPLKVLHSFLELDYKNIENENKMAFVGISNWKLDASKMNRGIYLNVFSPESNENDMIDTAFEISKIYSKSFITEEKYENLIKYLSKAVYKYKKGLFESKDINRNFHGTRDFYNLIKSVVRNILNKKDCNLIDEVFFSIECNYNGLFKNNESSSSKAIEKELIKNYPLENENKFNKFNIIQLITNNIKDNESRYLLLITQSSLSQYLVIQMLKEEQDEREIIYYLGSLFEEDKYNEIYSSKAITKIKYYLGEPIILILKNLSTTYASLYDLFNQRFTYSLGKKYAEISIRDVTNPTLVNDSLRIIVLITKEALEQQDLPFINRFEKYIISFESLLNKKEKEIAIKFMDIKNLFKMIEGLKCNPENELINFYKEEINGMIFNSRIENKDKELNYEDYENYILSKLSKTLPQELIMFLNVYQIEYKNIVQKINKYYKKTIHSNLKNYLINVKSSKNVIYTFTSIIKIKFNFEIINNTYGQIKGEEIKHVLVKNIKSERDLEKIVDDFYLNIQNLLMVHFEKDDLENLEFISSFIERIEKEKNIGNKNEKLFLIIIHLKRSINNPFKEIFISNLSSYEQSFVDNLHGRDEEIYDLIDKTQKELFSSSLINVEEEFLNNIYSAFTKIEYIFEDKTNPNQFIQNNINILLNDNELKKYIIEKIINKIE